MTSCDLKSCYDRIVHVAVILSLIRAGIPLNPAISMFQTLQDFQHSIRTAFDDPNETYEGIETPFIHPLQETRQGNGTGSQVWDITSSGTLQTLHDKDLATNMITPISNEQQELCEFTFINNADIIANAGYVNNPELTTERMQSTIYTW